MSGIIHGPKRSHYLNGQTERIYEVEKLKEFLSVVILRMLSAALSTDSIQYVKLNIAKCI